MTQSVIRKVLDTNLPNGNPVYASKGDYNSRYINAIITAEKKPIKVDINAQIVVNVTRTIEGVTEAKRFSDGCYVNEDGSIMVKIPYFAIENEGSSECTVSILSENSMLTTMPITIIVAYSAWRGEISPDDPEYDIINTVLQELSRISAEIEKTNQKNEEISQEIEEINSEILKIQNEVVENSDSLTRSITELDEKTTDAIETLSENTNSQIESLEDAINKTNSELESQVQNLDAKITDLKDTLNTENGILNERIEELDTRVTGDIDDINNNLADINEVLTPSNLNELNVVLEKITLDSSGNIVFN